MLLALVTFSVGVLPWWGGVALIAGNPILGLFVILICKLVIPTRRVAPSPERISEN